MTPVTTLPTPTTTPNTAVANMVSNCLDSALSDLCNAGGNAIKVTDIKPSGTLAKGTLNNAVTSQGWVSNVTITANGKLEGDLVSLGQDPFQSEVTLPATFDVALYHGVLLATGLIQVHFGYLLPDGTVVQSQQPLELTVAK